MTESVPDTLTMGKVAQMSDFPPFRSEWIAISTFPGSRELDLIDKLDHDP
jgi:hypothetical protein